MNKIKILGLILVLLFNGKDLCGQKIFRDGYVVKKSGETLNGLVEYSSKKNIPAVCTFKRFDIARSVVYTPAEIQAFGYTNGNRFESKEENNKNSFYEVIVSGRIVLYQKGSKYYIDKDHLGLTELKNGQQAFNSAEGRKEFKNLSEFLGYITEGKAGKISEKFKLEDDIVPLIASYNKESGKGFNVFNRTISEKQLTHDAWKSGASKNRLGVIAGVNLYKLNLTFSEYFRGSTTDRYVPRPGSSMGPVAGLTYERLLFRKTDRISLRLDILYTSQTFYSFNEAKNSHGGITLHDAYIDFTAIKVPVLLQYSFTGGRIVPFINAGIAYQYFIDKNYRHIAEVGDIYNDIDTSEDKNMLFNPGEFSGVGGMGMKTRISTNLNFHIMLMAEYGTGFFRNVDPTNNSYARNAPYIQNSFQTALLFGLTF